MFTGIVQSIGTVEKADKKEAGYRFVIKDAYCAARVQLGSSVCVQGVCLTVAELDRDSMAFDVMPETVRKTTFGEIRPGDTVNMEPSLRMGDELGGHFVFGHVDCTAIVDAVERDKDNWLVTIVVPEHVYHYLAPQGTISVDGVSLTIARLGEGKFVVSLVEYTWEHTTLHALKPGNRVNIEADMLAKYVANAVKRKE